MHNVEMRIELVVYELFRQLEAVKARQKSVEAVYFVGLFDCRGVGTTAQWISTICSISGVEAGGGGGGVTPLISTIMSN